MSNIKAIHYFMVAEGLRDGERFFSAREISNVIGLSLDRTRRHLSKLTFEDKLEVRVDGWTPKYRALKP